MSASFRVTVSIAASASARHRTSLGTNELNEIDTC